MMKDNQCGCKSEETEFSAQKMQNNADKSVKNEEYDCNDTSVQGNGKKEEKEKEEISSKNMGCGCNGSSTETSDSECECDEILVETDVSGCGCGDVEYPDQSQVNNPEKAEFIASGEFMKEFETYAKSLGISSIGYTQITPDLLIKERFISYPHTIVLTMAIGEEIINSKPGEKAHTLNDSLYAEFGEITYKLSDYLRKNGYATEVAHPYEGGVNFSPLGQKAGLGWIGKSGLLITPELGPRLKISAIFVSIANLPETSQDDHSWISDYCSRCSKCIKACPEKALKEKETFCGEKETEMDQKLCIGCSQGCTYCIEDCPFHSKGYDHLKVKFDKMTEKLRTKNKNNKNKCC